jgi:RimJ/RimL family protein N-acetyltransferase
MARKSCNFIGIAVNKFDFSAFQPMPRQFETRRLELILDWLPVVQRIRDYQIASFSEVINEPETREFTRYFHEDLTGHRRYGLNDEECGCDSVPAYLDRVANVARSRKQYGYFIADKKDEDIIIGWAGVSWIQTGIPEPWIWLAKNASGKGLGSEALGAIKQELCKRGIDRFRIRHSLGNQLSRNMALKNGFADAGIEYGSRDRMTWKYDASGQIVQVPRDVNWYVDCPEKNCPWHKIGSRLAIEQKSAGR